MLWLVIQNSLGKKISKTISVRISFVKGWGENYARKYVTDTLCWVELTINTPMDWVDKVSRNMRESHYKVPSYRSSYKFSIYNGSFTLKEFFALLDKLIMLLSAPRTREKTCYTVSE